jgi:hypothetical protein
MALVAYGHTVSEAAAEVGQSRFAVRGAINRWALPQAIAVRSAR